MRSQSGQLTSTRIALEVTEGRSGHAHSHAHLPSLPRLPRAGTMQGPLGCLPGLCCDFSTWETRLRCQTPAPCFISNAGVQDGVPGPRFHNFRSCSCLTAGTGPGVCPGTFTAGVQKCVGWGPVLSCLRGTQETLDLSLCPLPADLSKHTPMGHFLPKGVCGDFDLSAALGEENPGPL